MEGEEVLTGIWWENLRERNNCKTYACMRRYCYNRFVRSSMGHGMD